ncbi:MAG: mandelate racemase/muconate lactonizing enzyme family protein [bacterium]|nr:mandelate racemase/muconate lactonizing enzyme family protein [bacterium]
MKITRIDTLCLSRAHEPKRQWVTARYRSTKADCAIVIIETDGNLRGIGEACAYGVPPDIKRRVASLAVDLVGKDPSDPSIVPSPTGGPRAEEIAIAGLDCALWDLRGKIAKKKVSELLTSKPLHRVRLYASSGCMYDWDKDPEQLVREAIGYADQGLTAMKLRLGTDWGWSQVTPDRFIALARKVTDAVGDRMELMLDGNCRLTEEEALPIARALDEMGWTWFEEPIPRDPDAYARLNAAVQMPITGGEPFTTLAQFEPYFAKNAFAIAQPDAGVCGITECFKIALRAHELGVELCPHSWHNGLMAMANGHLVAALPNPRVLELCMIQGPLQWDILKEKPAIQDGFLIFPDAPGLGVEIADNLEERFPYIEGNYAIQVTR